MIFQLLRLWWYCWKNDIYFKWETCQGDPSYYSLVIHGNKYNKWIYLLVSKHPCREPYKVYNRIRRLINYKLIKYGYRNNIKNYDHDFGSFKARTSC